ncbi:MAG: stage sporulation protein [Petroclostridium sp.]|jgi:stage V sporulation protein AD|uniref:stage V sporulation protein AD n=1 Tax=Petroclostridium xylanilyticum TaxID=1792311 RepID=UPI000B9817E1|nr:stage V sporulation protein AD [Petroclostridium xylanilyticum]MBZ4644683.1 spoVAD [Clostridia bacterium]MDK2810548.1 stage sporulation protein [Petroclostridium sp.]
MTTTKRLGKQTVKLQYPPSIISTASIVGKKEGEGPLKDYFDQILDDGYWGEKTWEKAESKILRETVIKAVTKANMSLGDMNYIFAGDLLNQCIGSSFGIRELEIPFFGLYGACSTMAESLSLAAMIIDGGFADYAVAATSSHFCSAERQFRFPLEYGGQRSPTSQWTVTGAGAVVLSNQGNGPYVTHITTGKIVDLGIKDANNMGAAMAPAAADTIFTHFEDTGFIPDDYDLIITGDLAQIGKEITEDILQKKGCNISRQFTDCGLKIFDNKRQDTHAGGSGCGCSAAVLAGYLYHELTKGSLNKILFIATGALMSPTSSQQGESIPGIAHAVTIQNTLG